MENQTGTLNFYAVPHKKNKLIINRLKTDIYIIICSSRELFLKNYRCSQGSKRIQPEATLAYLCVVVLFI